jgi:hypothetical protein
LGGQSKKIASSLGYIVRPCLKFINSGQAFKATPGQIVIESLSQKTKQNNNNNNNKKPSTKQGSSGRTLPVLFCFGYFQDRVLQTICPDWP